MFSRFLRLFRFLATMAMALLGVAVGAHAQEALHLADLLPPGSNLSDPALRAQVVSQLRLNAEARKRSAHALAFKRGLPTRFVRADGRIVELLAFEGDRPLYATTHNVNAAISTGASLLQASPFSLNGSGLTVGVWDGGAVRSTHQEFGSRITVKDGASVVDHSTHVGGTIAAAGVDPAAKGMGTALKIDSYEWTSDRAEMTARAATYPGESGTIQLSNHSYGYISGWNYTGKASPVWDWWGNGTTATSSDADFGRYDTNARDTDALAVAAPYYLILRSAGNDRYDNPSAGQSVSLTANGSTAVAYDPALHPAGDAVYRGGYENIGFEALAKNVLTVGSASDAVNGTTRSVGAAFVSGYSCWGPTDDGRIKPDVVANGENLYSSLGGSNTAYGVYSGTSMASPNATGSAALLLQYFDQLFPGRAMQASTIKGLLIHTADDLGAAGPDYQNGWGLLNVKAAADLLKAYQTSPGTFRIIEERLTTASPARSHAFTWDGLSPIRATLVWTDPAGTAVTAADSRTASLVNNLDLKITGPTGTVYSPFVMPYVGNWSTASIGTAAVTGKNNTDNVEQVLVASPGTAGTYTVQVTVDGTLSGGVQNFSLLLSGGTATASAPAPTASAISPAAASTGSVTLNLTGTNLLLGATLKLTKSGQADVAATGVEALGDTLKARINVTGLAPGLWNVVAVNPDGQTATLAGAFSVIGPIWQEDFESGATGWTHSASVGSSAWALSTAQSRSSSHSYFGPGPSTRTSDELYSPAISIPAGATNLQLTFWHSYNFQSGSDGGVLEYLLDSASTYADVTTAGSGFTVASGGYNASISNSGNPNGRNPLAGRSAWSGNSAGFVQAAFNLDATKLAGHTLRLRWRLGTDSGTASTGWAIDDLSLTGGGVALNSAPNITSAAAATPSPVTGTSTNLSVSATDDGGAGLLTYTWSAVGGSFGSPVSFSENGTNAASATTATFTGAGTYTFTVTVRDGDGVSASSSIDVTVQQTPTSASLSPTTVTLGKGATQLFASTVTDQFDAPLSSPPTFVWSTSGGGSIASDGTFTAATVGGPFTVTGTSGAFAPTASVTVTGQTLTAWGAAYFSGTELTAGLGADTADPDFDGWNNLTEYALGSNPRAFNAPLAAVRDGTGHLTLTVTRPKNLPGLLYRAEVASSLGAWTLLDTPEVLADGDPQTIRFRDPLGTAESPQRFIRLRIDSTNP